MKNLKEEMLRVHRNSERIVIFAGVTKPNEFEYTHGGRVKPNVEYHIHYTVNKNEVYMTGATHTASSKIIKKINGDKTMYKKYTELVRQPRELYPRKNNPYPSDSDYRSKVIQRYFTQKVNNLNGELFEISKDDFDNQFNFKKGTLLGRGGFGEVKKCISKLELGTFDFSDNINY